MIGDDVMKRVAVKKGDVVIRQGDQGDWFYVVDEGEYVVTLDQGGKDVEILREVVAVFDLLPVVVADGREATVGVSIPLIAPLRFLGGNELALIDPVAEGGT